ncbi:hypothetical protein ALC56_03519 [Trachymyrmex septentrionalis]|uniref:Uncharacterized protein n=1 Tax=Trachymyrmex septentrionalis TaxID=34720 RepID=A0A151JZT7_9HYME|nr:hypothetical protein ALC56_03519 [Trachymyrmex septentrionalis]
MFPERWIGSSWKRIQQLASELTERARDSFKYRLQKCIEVRGHYFEHLLK